MNLLVCGDLHLKESLGYSEYIKDGRKAEKKEILDFILNASSDCDGVVFLGDQLNLKNNPSEVIREFVEFIESFGDKKIYMLAGNHEKQGDGKSAIDFIREVNKPNWHVITDNVEKIDNLVFCPYFFKGELGTHSLKTATDHLVKTLPEGDILFAHHAVSDMIFNGISTNSLGEIVLPKKTMVKRYKMVVCGHIHVPQIDPDNHVVQAGSIFNNEMGESGKKIYKINTDTGIVNTISLPGRQIIKLQDPSDEDIDTLSKDGTIIKAVFSKPITKKRLSAIKDKLSGTCDAFIISENIKNMEREKAHIDSVMNMSVEDLLRIYAKEKKINIEKVLHGFTLVS